MEKINLDYNDFRVKAYVNLAANQGLKLETRKAAVTKPKSRMSS